MNTFVNKIFVQKATLFKFKALTMYSTHYVQQSSYIKTYCVPRTPMPVLQVNYMMLPSR